LVSVHQKGIAMMATLRQGNQISNLILQLGIDTRALQKLLESGLLSDLLQGNIELLDRTQFRELIGLKPLSEIERRKRSADPLERYPWLGRKFCFTAMSLDIEDGVRNDKFTISRTATKKLKIKALKVDSPEGLKQKAEELIFANNTYECEVLDQHGQTIGSLSRSGISNAQYDQNWDFKFEDARFLTFRGAEGGWTVILYEIDPK